MKNDTHFIPNKITFIVLGSIIFATIGYAAFYSFNKNKKNVNTQSDLLKVTLVDEKKQDQRLIDSDNDGAYDWVEELWPELDPHNPDSDGDGVLDGKYIQQKRKIREKTRLGENEIQSNLTETEKLGRSVYTALLAINNSGGSIDENTQEKISDNIAKYISDLSLGSKVYLRENMHLVPDNKKNSYTYRDKMIDIFKRYPVKTSEINLIINASKNPDNYKKELERATLKYDEYINELAIMKVPYLIAGRHTQLLNTISQLYGSLSNLSLEDYDEVVALSSLVQIEKIMNTIVEVNLKIGKYFDIISDESIFQ